MIFDMLSCGGCKTCELACSFHNTRKFSHQFSSLKIINKKNSSGYQVLIAEQDDNANIPCDGCKDIKIPLCLQFCGKRDDLEKIIDEFKKAKL